MRERLNGDARMVTLTGSPGIGKTRLAGELLVQMNERYDSAVFIRLAEIGAQANTADVMQRICNLLIAELRISHHQPAAEPVEVLIDHVSERRVLIMLDNCEPVLDAVAELADRLITETTTVQVVATSRAYLDIRGEHVVHLAPLSIPAEHADRATAEQCDAIRLLADRAVAAGRPLTDQDDWSAIVDLVRWSAGVPLVLELVAAQLGAGRAPAVVLDRLQGGASLRYGPGARGIPAHHLALDIAITESWDLCSQQQQRVWARLTVFTGGFTLEAAEQVCADDLIERDEILATLDHLVRHSVIEGASSDARYRQHTFLREYGRRRLRAFGELDAIGERHCAWVAGLVREAAVRYFGPEEIRWLDLVNAESRNITAAVAWCAEHDRTEGGLAIMVDLFATRAPFFFATEIQACRLVEDLLSAGPTGATEVRISALAMAGWVWIALGDQERGKIHLDECLRLAREAGKEDTPAVQLVEGTYEALALGLRSGFAKLAAAAAGFRAAGADGLGYMADLFHAITAGVLGPAEDADRMSQRCLAEARRRGAEWALTWAEWTRGLPACSEPVINNTAPLRRQLALGDLWGPGWWVEKDAWARAEAGDYVGAARRIGGSDSLQARHGVHFNGLAGFKRHRGHAAAAIALVLGPVEATAAYREGSMLDDDQIVALALDDADCPPEPVLTERQWTIARLVARKLKNQQIAATVQFSVRTVENELSAIYDLLNLEGRRELADWYMARSAPTGVPTEPATRRRRG
ncbi:LuxR family transcriptional regulator [Amycolatopsis sp. NBRC 101858]|uniref:ATP-binding protein n=1 Tax=Amycolatopsis sp. NBRC 101858 TaxID=3032200 RepID=UPI0024A0463B|nr:AAA family ATPase [Amycolatopsis sp. NBRC 101858]GLY43033.1 LuxR family transcriptional regulator [Amycolatopsis sp. NBRC 101858]